MKRTFYIVSLLYSFCLTGMEVELPTVVHLYSAMEGNNFAQAQKIVERNPRVVHEKLVCPHLRDTVTPLHLASNEEWAQLLIKHGANVNKRSKNGLTPLDYVCFQQQCDVHLAAYLIRCGAHVNNSDSAGDSLLHRIMKHHESYIPLWIPFLIEHGANPEAHNRQGKTPLDLAIDKREDDIIAYNKEQMSLELMESRDLTKHFKKAGIMFFYANNDSCIDPYQLLKNDAHNFHALVAGKYGTHVNVQAEQRIARLFMFVTQCEQKSRTNQQKGCHSSQGIMVNSYGYFFKNTTFNDLETWVGERAVQSVKKHFKQRCKTILTMLKDQRAVASCMIEKYPFVVNYDEHIRSAFCDYMTENVDDAVTSSLILNSIDDINFIDGESNTVLHRAVLANNVKLLTFMTGDTFSPIVNFTKKNNAGLTALALAKKNNTTDCIEALYKGLRKKLRCIGQCHILRKDVTQFLNEECDINRKSTTGKTLLHAIAKNYISHWGPFLLQHGARINVQDNKQHSPLSIIIQKINQILRARFGKEYEENAMAFFTLLLHNGALVTPQMIRVSKSQDVTTMLQEAYNNQQCVVCYERPAIMGDIPCTNMHRGTFLCKDCCGEIKGKTNACPMCQKKLGAHEPFQ